MNGKLARSSVLVAVLCTSAAPGLAQSPAQPIGILNERVYAEGVTIGGQPTAGQLRVANEQGVKTVISLRDPREQGAAGEAEAVEALGMRFVNIPVSSLADLSEAKTLALVEALAASRGPVLLHCASGDRVGALLALKAFFVDEQHLEAAVAEGRRSGLTGLEAPVRQRMASECGARTALAC